MKIEVEYDEHGCMLCPLCPSVPRCADECQWRSVHVVWEFSVPLSNDLTAVSPADVAAVAITSGWKVTCINGHVLALSEGEEDAEPFYGPALFDVKTPVPVAAGGNT